MSRIGTLPTREAARSVARVRADVARRPGAVLAALVGLVLLALLALIPLPLRSVDLDVGAEHFRAPDETDTVRRMAGFHEPETAGGVSFRWTKAWARLIIPNGHRLGNAIELRLRMCGCRRSGAQPVAQLALDSRAAGGLPTSDTYRRYAILVPPGSGEFGHDLFIELRTPTSNFDGRPVGVRVDRIDLLAAPARALPWPQPLLLAVAGACAALLAAWLNRPAAVRLALVGGLIAGPALVSGVYRPQELAPAALAIAELCGVLLVALARPRSLVIALPLLAAVAALPLLPQLLGGWLVDDAFVSFRYAQQFVAGNGLVFNAGERVEGYTNFLWTMLVAAVLRLGGDPAYLTRLITLLIAQATVVLCYAAGRRLAYKPAADTTVPGRSPAAFRAAALLIAPLLLATSGPFLLYSARGSGMETALFTLLVLAEVWAYAARRLALCGALLALAALTRPEGVLILGVTVLHALVWPGAAGERWRRAALPAGAFLAIFLPYYLWRFVYYGLPLPNTFYVKVGATSAQVLRGLDYLAGYWAAEGWAWGAGALVLAAVWIAGRWARGASRAGGSMAEHTGYVALLALAYLAYIVAIGGDWLPEARFVVPAVPLVSLLAQAGLLWLGGRGRAGMAAAGLLLALALFDHTRHTLATSAYDPRTLIWRENDVVSRRREVGRWLREHTPPDTLVAVEAAGALPYYSRRPVIDILGLNDRHIASLDVATIGQGKPGHEKTDIPYVLARRPDIIPYFSAPYFRGQPAFEQRYVREEHDGPEGYTVVIYRRNGP